MKTVIIGGGRGCLAIIDLAFSSFLKELKLEIIAIVDTDPDAPGVRRARELAIQTYTDINEALSVTGVELVIELTGDDEVLQSIHKILPAGMKLIDHTVARIFWDIANVQQERQLQLEEMTRLEQKVQNDWAFLNSLFNTIPEPTVVLGKDKRITNINAGFAQLSSLSPEQTVGKDYKDLLTNTELEIYLSQVEEILDDVLKNKRQRQLICQTSFPEEAYWEVTHTPILSDKWELESIVGTWHRITERIMLHREVERAEQRFKSFIDSAHDWISIKDVEGRYVIVNPVCAQAFHRTPEEFIGKRPDELLSPEILSIVQDHDQEVIECNCHRTYEEIYLIDGHRRHYHTVRFPLSDNDGSVIGVCTIARDVTSERELQDQLIQSTKLAAVGGLAAEVAHEINNPLTGVLAFAEDMIADLKEDDPFYEGLHVIIRETLRCREIVRSLLDFSRAEKLQLENKNPNEIVERSLLMVQKLPQFRNIEIRKELADNLPEIECDRRQLQQVILNLMLNASDAMKGVGIIIIRTRFELRLNQCIIAVEDNGPGVPTNIAKKVFDPFFSTKGTNGLGLAVSQGIIQRHRGTIEVDKAESGGAIFRICLPALAGKSSI
jgi:two-component system, NtrC family, sensor kinase